MGNFHFIVFEIVSCVNDENFFRIVSFKPIFMFMVDLFKILKWDFILFCSLSNFGSLVTSLRCTTKINNLRFFLRCHWLKAGIKWFKNFMLAFIHVPAVLHQFWKDIFVSKNASFRDFKLVWISIHGLLKLFDSCEDGIDLEGKSPSFGISVVFLKHINLLSTKILPFSHRLFNPFSLRNSLSQKFEESWLSTSNVSLNSKTEIVGSGLRIDEIFGKNLILISR